MSKLLLVLALTGCYSPDFADCAVTCATDSDCGGDQVCSTGLCARTGLTCSFEPGRDAMVAVELDAAIPDSSSPDPDAPAPDPDAPPPTTTLRVKIKDQGQVTPSGMATCMPGQECTYQVPIGEPITLTASPHTNRIFEKWEEACAGHLLPICTITPMAGPETRVTAKFKKLGGGPGH